MKCVLLQVSGERKRNGTLGRNGIETKVQLAIITAKINDRNKIKYTIIRAADECVHKTGVGTK